MQNTVVLYPAPGMGHVISMVELGKLILRHSDHQFLIKILLITSDLWDNYTISSYIQHVSQTLPLISFFHFPFVSVHTTPTRSRAAMSFECIRLNASNVVRSLQEISETSKISAFVIDLFCTSALSVGKDLGFPTCYFFTSGAACLGAFLYLEKVHQEHTNKSFKDLTETFLHFPTLPPLKAIHMPEPVLDRWDPAYDDFIYFCSNLKKSDGIIVNTFEELEPKAVRIIADGSCVVDGPTPPVHYIGPLIAARSEAQHDCLSWLQKQPSNSVVFLCFGSRGSFSREQVEEIAKGLERSEQRFLWVIKNPPREDKSNQTQHLSDFDLNELLPDGFLDRVTDKGMVVKSWAPQVAVLSQESVGGFVTHCGWNSVLEAVVAGVPMVAWPLYAEQHMNKKVLVEVMKMAVGMEQRDEDNFVSADEVERSVRELMDSDKGRELKERSWKMKERAMEALQESGSSTRALANLVQLWKQH